MEKKRTSILEVTTTFKWCMTAALWRIMEIYMVIWEGCTEIRALNKLDAARKAMKKASLGKVGTVLAEVSNQGDTEIVDIEKRKVYFPTFQFRGI